MKFDFPEVDIWSSDCVNQTQALDFQKMIEAVDEFLKKDEHKKCDSAVIVIMTHGATDEKNQLILFGTNKSSTKVVIAIL